MQREPWLWLLAILLICTLAVPTAYAFQDPPKQNPAPEVQAKGEEPDQDKDEDFEDDKNLTKEQREALEKKACGPKEQKFKTETDKAQHPTPEAPPDKALIYVIRPTKWGHKVQTKLGVDGKWVGVNRGNNYFFFTLDPGEHYFCSQAENHSLMVVKLEAGKTYFLQQKIKMGAFKARNKLVKMSDAEGRAGLAKSHPSTWTEKGAEGQPSAAKN
jgi:hypothetical protein